MNETLETSEKIAQIYQPNNTIEYVAVMAVIAYALFLASKYFMNKKKTSPDSNKDIKEDLKEIKDMLKDISLGQVDSGKKLARDYTRLNEHSNKFETLFDNMNESNKDIAEIKGRLA